MSLDELEVLDVAAMLYSLGLGERCACGALALRGPDCPACDSELQQLNGLTEELGDEGN